MILHKIPNIAIRKSLKRKLTLKDLSVDRLIM